MDIVWPVFPTAYRLLAQLMATCVFLGLVMASTLLHYYYYLLNVIKNVKVTSYVKQMGTTEGLIILFDKSVVRLLILNAMRGAIRE